MFATNNMNGVSKTNSAATQWKVGLVNYQGKYLTAETFGFKINASANSLRKKQLWIIEHDDKLDEVVYVKSHLGRYLAGDRKGNVTCDSETKGDNEKFSIQYNADGSGRWAIKNHTYTYYFGGTDDNLLCYEKTPGQSEWWTVQLAIHPQVSMKNANRKTYAHLDATNDKIQVDRLIPWGHDALLTLEFREGKYAIKTWDNRYLHRQGDLVQQPSPDTLYTLEIKSGQYSGMALKDVTGKYLTGVGRDAIMQGRNKAISKDELFTLEDSHPQAFFTAHNGKVVSIKQGVDLSANQDNEELTDREIFQLEYDKKNDGWRFRTVDNKFWCLEQASGIQGVGNETSQSGLFTFEYHEDGRMSIKATNGRYLTARLNGSLYAVSDAVTNKEKFTITILNRPILILKCDYGFIGFKTPSNPRLECNKSASEIFYLEHANGESTSYFIKGQNDKYFNADADGNLNADSDQPQPFIFELKGLSRFLIKAPNGNYVKGEQNGIVSAKNPESQRATLWEY
eukprot:GHVU01189753.1.p1 GENE.GHVU01189753.1~~GHVU01189753.1.p1  ORF type:complete len:511 (+),score=69.79 GHVU01189753.1:237-1769(+)